MKLFTTIAALTLASAALVGCGGSDTQSVSTSKPVTVLTEAQVKARAESRAVRKALINCEVIVRSSLKNPSSYKRISNRWELKESERLVYSATNSFGAVVRDSFDCSPIVTAALKELT